MDTASAATGYEGHLLNPHCLCTASCFLELVCFSLQWLFRKARDIWLCIPASPRSSRQWCTLPGTSSHGVSRDQEQTRSSPAGKSEDEIYLPTAFHRAMMDFKGAKQYSTHLNLCHFFTKWGAPIAFVQKFCRNFGKGPGMTEQIEIQ